MDKRTLYTEAISKTLQFKHSWNLIWWSGYSDIIKLRVHKVNFTQSICNFEMHFYCSYLYKYSRRWKNILQERLSVNSGWYTAVHKLFTNSYLVFQWDPSVCTSELHPQGWFLHTQVLCLLWFLGLHPDNSAPEAWLHWPLGICNTT